MKICQRTSPTYFPTMLRIFTGKHLTTPGKNTKIPRNAADPLPRKKQRIKLLGRQSRKNTKKMEIDGKGGKIDVQGAGVHGGVPR